MQVFAHCLAIRTASLSTAPPLAVIDKSASSSSYLPWQAIQVDIGTYVAVDRKQKPPIWVAFEFLGGCCGAYLRLTLIMVVNG